MPVVRWMGFALSGRNLAAEVGKCAFVNGTLEFSFVENGIDQWGF